MSGGYTKWVNTPTESECGEIQGGYQEAFEFWIHIQFNQVSEKRYNATAERFDDLPGVSGFFRFLCIHTLTREDGNYVLRKTHGNG
jgi:hypothetical protein